MGKVLPTVYVTKEEDLLVSKDGPFSIVTGRNLKTSSTASSKKPKAQAPTPASSSRPGPGG